MNIAADKQLREEQRAYGLAMAKADADDTSGRVVIRLPRPDALPRPMTGMTGKIADAVRSSKVAPKVKVSPKGHEAFLKALEASGAPVTFEKVSSGEKITGSIKHSDKYTISVLCDNATRVLFKHDISEFQASFPDRKPSAEV